jgi:hypothetical protein
MPHERSAFFEWFPDALPGQAPGAKARREVQEMRVPEKSHQ